MNKIFLLKTNFMSNKDNQIVVREMDQPISSYKILIKAIIIKIIKNSLKYKVMLITEENFISY